MVIAPAEAAHSWSLNASPAELRADLTLESPSWTATSPTAIPAAYENWRHLLARVRIACWCLLARSRSCLVPTYPLELCPERAPVTQRHPHHEFLQQFLQVFFKDVIFSQVRGVSAPIAHLPPPPSGTGGTSLLCARWKPGVQRPSRQSWPLQTEDWRPRFSKSLHKTTFNDKITMLNEEGQQC